jgi:hypothetical protein
VWNLHKWSPRTWEWTPKSQEWQRNHQSQPIELPGVLSEIPAVMSEEGGDNPQPTQNPDTDGDSDGPPPPLSPRSENTSDNADSDEDDEHDEEIPDDDIYHPDTITPPVQSTYGLRPKMARDNSHLHANIVHHAMTQYSLNRGLQKFREKGEKAVEKELGQLHMKETFSPVQVGDLSPIQKREPSSQSCF